MSKIYVASSWRNLPLQQAVCGVLRSDGHTVYDFTHPAPGNTGFAWSQIDDQWLNWSVNEFAAALESPIAQAGFQSDRNALRAADVCVLVLPCGRSAHLELGYAAGAGKRTIVFAANEYDFEPELMYLLCDAFVTTTQALRQALTHGTLAAQ